MFAAEGFDEGVAVGDLWVVQPRIKHYTELMRSRLLLTSFQISPDKVNTFLHLHEVTNLIKIEHLLTHLNEHVHGRTFAVKVELGLGEGDDCTGSV